MDTKLKNSRNVRIGIIIIGLLLAVGVNVSLFPWMIRNAEQKSAQLFSSSENVNTEYIDTLYQGAYVLYTEIKNEPSENRTEPFVGEGSGYDDYDYISEWSSSFEGVRSETDYYATDGAKKEVNTNAPLYEVLEPDFRIDDDKEQWNSYESVFVLDFDEDGNLSVDVKKDGTVSADTLIKSLLQADRYNEIRTYAVDNDTSFVPVKNFQVVYGIPKDSTNLAYADYYTSDYYLVASGGGDAAYFITLLVNCGICMLYVQQKSYGKMKKMPDYLPKGSQSLPEWKPFLFRFLPVCFQQFCNIGKVACISIGKCHALALLRSHIQRIIPVCAAQSYVIVFSNFIKSGKIL